MSKSKMIKQANRYSSRALGVGLAVLFAALISGCSSLTKSDSPAISNWWLKPLQGGGAGAQQNSTADKPTKVLLIVSVVPGLDTANILNLSPDAQLSHYSGARWADEVPELMTSLVARSLEANGNFQVVSRRDSRDLDRCILRLDLSAFYAELNRSGSTEDVHIAYTGEYRCDGEADRPLEFDSRTPVNADKMSSIVASYQTGLNAAIEQLLQQIQ